MMFDLDTKVYVATLLAEVFILSLLFPSLFMAVFTGKENSSSKDSHEKTRK